MIATAEVWAQTLVALGVLEGTAVRWAPAFAESVQPGAFAKGIEEMDNFIGQILHESGMLETMEESLNYSALRLTQVWPKRFPTLDDAAPYAHQPVKLANKVYGGRLGNTETGDGWKYRGSGLIQLTGRANFAEMEAKTGLPLTENPDLLRVAGPTALKVSMQWWKEHVNPEIVDDILKVTRAVNGGLTGLLDRQRLTALAYQQNKMFS